MFPASFINSKTRSSKMKSWRKASSSISSFNIYFLVIYPFAVSASAHRIAPPAAPLTVL